MDWRCRYRSAELVIEVALARTLATELGHGVPERGGHLVHENQLHSARCPTATLHDAQRRIRHSPEHPGWGLDLATAGYQRAASIGLSASTRSSLQDLAAEPFSHTPVSPQAHGLS